MTDGIIQKVFMKWKKYSNTPQCRQDIIDIEQELIKEIDELFTVKKSIVNHKGLPTGLFHIEDIIMKLIGESK